MADGNVTEIKLGVLMGFTGPIESLTPAMAEAAEYTMAEVSQSRALLGGIAVTPVRADTTCLDAGAGTAAATRLIAQHDIAGIIGASCSGVTQAILTDVAVPNEIVMVSPSASADGLSGPLDNGFFFRTASAESRGGMLMAADLMSQDVDDIAIAFGNDANSRAIAQALQSAFEAAGGTVTIGLEYEYGRLNYSAENAVLAAEGGARLVIIGTDTLTGSTLADGALDGGFFDSLYFSSFLMTPELATGLGARLDTSSGLQLDISPPGSQRFVDVAGAEIDATAAFAAESYDAAALVMLAMQAAGSTDPAIYRDFMDDVANGSGVQIYAGELELGLNILKSGGRIDYRGASEVELTPEGDATGNYRAVSFSDGALVAGDAVLPLPGAGEDRITGSRSAETFKTGQGADFVDGKGGRDLIVGGSGFDTLFGGGGRDVLKGGRGQDRIEGGRGGDKVNGGKSDDVLTGGGGADRFIFAKRDGFDVITDWQERDVFHIKGVSGFNKLALDQADAGVIVSWAQTSVLVLETDLGDLGRDDFLFV